MKLSAFALSVLVAAMPLSACSTSNDKPILPKLTVGTVPWAGWSALDVAKAKGFFEEEGLDVEVKNFKLDGDVDLIEAIAKGDIDCGFYMQGTLLTYAMEQDKPITFLGEVDWSYGGDQIIARPPLENAVAAARAKSKKVGTYSAAASNLLLLDYYFRDTSRHSWTLDIATLDIAERTAPELVTTFKAGDDAFSLNFDPASKDQVKAGGEIVATSATYPGVLAEGLMSNAEKYKTLDKSSIRKLLKGWLRAVEYMYGPAHKLNVLTAPHEDEVVEILQRDTFQSDGSTKQDVVGYLANVRLHSLAKVESINLDANENVLLAEYNTKGLQPLRSHIKEVASFIKRLNPNAKDFDLNTGIDTQPLKEAIEELKARPPR
jgi:NitT/TauT family transport system substrate-binding protein